MTMALQMQRIFRAAAHARLVASSATQHEVLGSLAEGCGTTDSCAATTSYGGVTPAIAPGGAAQPPHLQRPACRTPRAQVPSAAFCHSRTAPGTRTSAASTSILRGGPRSFASSTASSDLPPAPSAAPQQGVPPTGSAGTAPGASEGAAVLAPAPAVLHLTLAEALGRLVDTAVELVGNNSLPEAINVLKEGITTLEPKFPNSAEIGELYNQVALLLFFQDSCDEAVEHAQISLDITRDRFGPASRLTAHRMLRLGTAKFGQGKFAEASKLLDESVALLGEDPSHLEGKFYQHLIQLEAIRDDAVAAARLTEPLLAVLRTMKAMDGGTGADNMVVTLMLAQHNQLLHAALERRAGGHVALGEALFRQHITLLEEVQTDTEELGITQYKLATFFYTHDMPGDGGAAIRRAAAIMRNHYPEDHDLMVLCRHRMGMLCVASGDHRSALQLLAQSKERYATKPETRGLAVEADVGLAYARCQAGGTAKERDAALEDMRRHVAELSSSVGSGHMLVVGAQGYLVKAAAACSAQARK